MILFKMEYVNPILRGKKTQTRRVGDKRWNKGAIHQAKTMMLSTDHFALLKILDVRQERLGDISLEDAKAEGHDSIKYYIRAYDRIYKKQGGWKPDEMVWVITFKVVPETDLKKGDVVKIVGSAEEKKYQGWTWTLIEDPKRLLGSGSEVVRMDLNQNKMPVPDDFKVYYSAYATEYLIKVN